MYLAIDVETNYCEERAARPWHAGAYLSTVAVADSTGYADAWAFRHRAARGLSEREAATLIQGRIDGASRVILHNAPFDMTWLASAGISLENARIWDTAVVEYLLTAQRAKMPSLNDLAKQYLGEEKYDVVRKDFWEKGIDTEHIPLDVLFPYNIRDCQLTLQIAQAQSKKAQELGLLPLINLKGEEAKCVCEIESHGLKLDLEVRQRLEDEYGNELRKTNERLRQLAGRNLNVDSPEHLSAFLYGGTYSVGARCWTTKCLKSGSTKITSRKDTIRKAFAGKGFTPLEGTEGKKPGQYSTDKGTLIQLYDQVEKDKEKREILDLLLERSSLNQMMKTYIVAVSDKHTNGIVHCSLNQTITATGRFSSSAPNLQNVPREGTAPVKEMFVPQFDYFVEGDASQLEWVVAAELSQCPVMRAGILAGEDQHEIVRQEIFGGKVERTIAKIFNFRMIYGGSPYSFFADPKMPNFTKKRWEKIVNGFYEKYFGLAQWHDRLVSSVYESKGTLRNPTGRLFRFDKFDTRNGREYRKPQIVNYPVQSFATADIIPIAMVSLRRGIRTAIGNQINKMAVMCNQVHDSIMYDTKKEYVDVVANAMIQTFSALPRLIKEWFGYEFSLPLRGEVKVGRNWMNMTKWSA